MTAAGGTWHGVLELEIEQNNEKKNDLLRV